MMNGKSKADPNSPRSSDIQLIEQALEQARPWGLEAEVVWSAMKTYEKYHKSAPETYNMGWAFECAINDWDI
jgi:hypothetical protein